MHLFNFKLFLKRLSAKEEKKELYKRWMKVTNSDILEEQPFYSYLAHFEPIPYIVDEGMTDDFDWNLLLRLTAASFSSTYAFKIPGEECDQKDRAEFEITVVKGGASVTKLVSELFWTKQIVRLFEIYFEEQMELQLLILNDPAEKSAIEAEREKRIQQYQLNRIKIINSLKRESLF